MSSIIPLDDIKTLQELREHYQDRLPKHLGLILDGNRRWIRKQGIENTLKGHLAGYQTLKKILLPIFEAGVHYLTVYALSSENVAKRSTKEVQYLFKLLVTGVEDVLGETLIAEKEVKVRLIGRLNKLPPKIVAEIEKMNKVTDSHNQNFINFCVLYDGQEEIVDAVKKIIGEGINSENINKSTVKSHLYTNKFPELDYIIRTGMDDGARISGFLLWDSSYAEFRFRNDLWPDYDKKMLLEDLKIYISRNRRKGV